MKLFFLFLSFLFVACSGSGESKNFKAIDLSPNEMKAKSLIQGEASILSNPQYQISDAELALLTKEGLISSQEKKSLKITK